MFGIITIFPTKIITSRLAKNHSKIKFRFNSLWHKLTLSKNPEGHPNWASYEQYLIKRSWLTPVVTDYESVEEFDKGQGLSPYVFAHICFRNLYKLRVFLFDWNKI